MIKACLKWYARIIDESLYPSSKILRYYSPENIHLYQDTNNPQVLTFIKKLDNEKAIEAHNQSEHFTTIVSKFGILEEVPTEVILYKAII